MSKFKINFLFKKINKYKFLQGHAYKHQSTCIKNIDSSSLKESATENCLTFGFNFNIKCI